MDIGLPSARLTAGPRWIWTADLPFGTLPLSCSDWRAGPGRDRRGGSFMRTIRSRTAVAFGAALAAVLAVRPGEATRDRHHERLDSGRRAALLVRSSGPREGRLRGAHLGPAGPGAVRRAR